MMILLGGQGTDGDGLQDEVVDGDKKEGVEDKCVRTAEAQKVSEPAN